jgi:hypothetical protein
MSAWDAQHALSPEFSSLSFCFLFYFILFYFYFYKYIRNYYNENLKEQKQEGLGNPNLNLKMKVRGGNASEDAGPLARGTDASKPGSPIKVISQVY